MSKGFTVDWHIHFQAEELEEPEAVDVGHDDVADNQVELVPSFLSLIMSNAFFASVTAVTAPHHKNSNKRRKKTLRNSIETDSRRNFTGAAKNARMLIVVVAMLQLLL